MSEVRDNIVSMVDIIENRKRSEESSACYKDVPYLKKIESLLEEAKEENQDNLVLIYEANEYIAEQYAEMGRFSVAAKYRLRSLEGAVKAFKNFDFNVEEIESVLYDLLRDRNYYIDDDCEDVRPLLVNVLPQEKVDEIYQRRMNRRRNLKNDPVEMSEEYLAVIDEIDEKIAQNRTCYGMGSCFEIWNLKEEFLLEKGIVWRSPSLLNPRVMFD